MTKFVSVNSKWSGAEANVTIRKAVSAFVWDQFWQDPRGGDTFPVEVSVTGTSYNETPFNFLYGYVDSLYFAMGKWANCWWVSPTLALLCSKTERPND